MNWLAANWFWIVLPCRLSPFTCSDTEDRGVMDPMVLTRKTSGQHHPRAAKSMLTVTEGQVPTARRCRTREMTRNDGRRLASWCDRRPSRLQALRG